MSKDIPAFPVTESHGANSGDMGMTLRDYFAAKAMQAFLSLNDPQGLRRAMEKAQIKDPLELIAQNSYDVADAMLRERAKEGGAE